MNINLFNDVFIGFEICIDFLYESDRKMYECNEIKKKIVN